jgi:hypothetical protein
MSEYSLVQRTVITADETDAGGVSPKDFNLASTVKPASAFITASVRDIRKNAFVQRGVENFVQATVFPFTVNLGTAVDINSSHVAITFKDSRVVTPTLRGVQARLINAGADIEFTAAALGAAETLDVSWEVIQNRQPRHATVRLLDADNVRLEWDGVLVAGEQIVASVDVFDIENFGDDVKEILFRQLRQLGYMGENSMQDILVFDTQGNLTSYRVRCFDSKTNIDLATPDVTGALETGELSRITFTQQIVVSANDRNLATEKLTDVAANPDIT